MKRILFTFLATLVVSTSSFAQLTLSPATPAQMVANLLGPGVTATNITWTGAPAARATFTCSGSCSLGFPAGIMLSTGTASGQTSPASYFASTSHNLPGDPQLAPLAPGGLATNDAAILEFDFSVASDSVKFEFIFGSEEYNDYVNTNFNDVFAFFISGPGIAGSQNMAVIPTTTTGSSIVSINNVNNGGPYPGTASGPCTNCQYYVDNANGTSFFLDGHTVPLMAKARVRPCETYHMKITIADVSDWVYDSAVFLKAQSFSSLGQISITANGVGYNSNATVYACQGDSVLLSLSPANNYNWNTGASTQSIWVQQPSGSNSALFSAFTFMAPSCFAFTTNINVVWNTPNATITPSGSLSLCPGGNVTLTANQGQSYLWSNGATSQSINVSAAGTYTVTVSNGPNCSATSTPVSVTVGGATATISGVLSLCNGTNTTLSATAGTAYLWNTGATTQSINVNNSGNYTVTVTANGGCTASATANVLVNPSPVPTISGTFSACQGSSATLNAVAGFTSYLWSNGATSPTINPSTAGNYTVTVTGVGGCTGTTSQAVTINSNPLPAITGTFAVCQGATATLNAPAGMTSYSWSNGATSPTITPGVAGTYTVTVTNATGCTGSTSQAVTINANPVPVISGSFTACQGSTATLNAAPAGAASYLWSNGATSASIAPNTSGTYTVTVTLAGGCSGTSSQAVSINPNPTPTIGGTFIVCQGANASLNATPGLTSYSWSNGATTTGINPNVAGTYTVTVTNASGCTGTTSQLVTINANPAPAIAGTFTVCQGASATLNATPGLTSYQWSNGATSATINPSATGTYTVTVTNSNGCTGTTSQAVLVNNNPTPVISGTFAVCSGSSATLNAPAGMANYVWSNGAVTSAINPSAAGTFTVTVTDANGCVGSTSQLVTINSNPVPNINGTFIACQGSTTTLNASTGFTYVWSNGATSGTINPGVAGPYTVTVTDINGCTGSTSQTVTINANPAPAIAGTFTVCQGASATLNATPGLTSYQWSNGAISATINPSATGTYTVTVTNSNGCTGTTSQAVLVNNNPTPVISGTFAVCSGSSATLNAPAGMANYVWSNGAVTSAINPSAAGTFTVTVTDANGCVGSTSQLVTINSNPVPNINGTFIACQGSTTTLNASTGFTYVWSNGATSGTINPGVAGLYTVTVTDINGCTGSTSQTVTINANPAPAIAGTFTVCQGASATLNATPGLTSYQWSNGAASATINPSATGTYTVTVTNSNGCTGTTSQAVLVNNNPTPVISGTFAVCSGSSATLNAPAGMANYVWSNGAVTSAINPSAAGTFTVTVTDANGCVGSTSQLVTINSNPVPSINGSFIACQGSTTTLNASTGFTYVWSNGATSGTINPGVAGLYTVTVTDGNGCTGSASQLVTINANPIPSISGTFAACQGFSASLNATPGLVSYLWSDGASANSINPTIGGTYTVTVTDANGCIGSASQLVTINANPTPIISGSFTVCQGFNASLNATPGLVSYLWSDGTSAAATSPAVGGIYTVTVTDANGCIGSTSQLVTINSNPVPAISGTFVACQGNTTTLNASAGFTYSWSNGSSAGTINPGVAGLYTVTVTDANGCTGSASQLVTINANPTPSISGTFAACQGFSTSINATPGLVSYLWSDGTSANSINPTIGGTYTVTVTDANGCIGNASQLVTINANPTPIISGSFTVCQGFNASLNATPSLVSYLWSDGTSAAAISPAVGGIYTVTVTDTNGCIGSTSQLVTINSNPVPAISGTFVACQGNTTTLNASVGFTYSWSNGSSAGTINPGVAGLYTVTVTDANGCTGSASQLVTINANPTPSISGTFAACQGFSTSLNATPGLVSYLWSDGTSTASISPATGGNYTVTVTDANGCLGSVSQLVMINANPIPVITGNNAICDGTTTSFNAGNYASHVWSDGSTTASLSTGTAGTYTVTVTDLNGCVGSTSQSLTVYTLPTATITGDNAICYGENSDLNVIFTGTAPFTYVWSNGITNSSQVTSNTNSSTVNVSPGSTSIYTLISVSDANCAGTLNGAATITVNPLPIPVIIGDLSICDGETSVLSAAPGYVAYTWSNSSNATSITTGTGGPYTVTVSDLNGCVGTSDPANLVVNMVPEVSFIADTVITCKEQKGVFTNTSIYDSGSSFSWTFGDGSTSSASNPAHLYLNQGTYPISLTITTPAGCVSSNTGSIDIVFFPLPVADFVTSPNINGVFNGKVEFVDRSDFAVSWKWDFGDGYYALTQNTEHYFNEVGDFNVRLTVTNLAGCEDTHSETVTIIPYFVPNAFTPNGDGINDNFFFSGYDLDVATYEMKIFDRWGTLMFSGQNQLDIWKGDGPGGDAPQGTYAYRIIVKTRGGKEHVFNGAVNLIR